MALGYPSHDNVTRMNKLFPKVAREPLSLSIDFKISTEHKGAMCCDSYKHRHLRKIVWVVLGTESTELKIGFAYVLTVLYVINR